MPTLTITLLAEPKREAYAADCVKVIEQHLNSLRSLRGLALKAGLAMFKTAVPDAIPRAVRKLMPDFVGALEPFYRQFEASAETDFGLYLGRHSEAVTQTLLDIVDRRVAASSSDAVRGAFGKLRSGLRNELQTLLPALAKTMSAHLD